jgi:hypothetical protein
MECHEQSLLIADSNQSVAESDHSNQASQTEESVFEMLCAGGPISMSTRLSRRAALLTALVFAVPAVGPTIAEAQADASDAANLYPGRYAAVCIPAPMFGCVCTTDPLGEALMFTELDSTANHHHLKDIGDTEYLRLIAWLRRTCASLTQSVVPP